MQQPSSAPGRISLRRQPFPGCYGSEVFFRELEIPEPDYKLGIGSGSHGAQTGRMLEAVEKVQVPGYGDAGAERPAHRHRFRRGAEGSLFLQGSLRDCATKRNGWNWWSCVGTGFIPILLMRPLTG